ncbi:MAG: ATP-dependent DNA ligase [Thermoanaerobaculia bacterium]
MKRDDSAGPPRSPVRRSRSRVSLPIPISYPPMEALSVEEIPRGEVWQYEPKWDGFRCLAFRDGGDVELQSKAGQPLARYFPEVVDFLRGLPAKRFVLDSEIVIPVGKEPSFDDLLQRIHPADSRVRKLAAEQPALLIVFDLLVDASGSSLVDLPLARRRPLLEAFAGANFPAGGRVRLSPATTELREARRWLSGVGGALDGIVAKRRDFTYAEGSGERTGMQKVKLLRTADCVVGGFRYASKGKVVGSLLLGLYDDEGRLDHVGFCSGLTGKAREELTPQLEALVKPPGFTGNAPGGPSRWSTERSGDWKPLAPKLVAEVQYDHFTGGRFRHGTRLMRWRPDKAPRQCTMDQVARRRRKSPLELLA